jgi:hypothetical protein
MFGANGFGGPVAPRGIPATFRHTYNRTAATLHYAATAPVPLAEILGERHLSKARMWSTRQLDRRCQRPSKTTSWWF